MTDAYAKAHDITRIFRLWFWMLRSPRRARLSVMFWTAAHLQRVMIRLLTAPLIRTKIGL